MNSSSILLVSISFATLLLGLYAWRLTSSKPLILNMLFASAGFLISAYAIAMKQPTQMAFLMPFFVTMLLLGRAGGIYWRTLVRGEKELSLPSHLVGAAALISVVGTFVAYANL